MSSKATEPTFNVIPSGINSMAKEVEILGPYGAGVYQNTLYRFMDHLCGGEYNGGVWDLREYSNGAIAWVFTKIDVIDVHTFNGYEVKCSMFAVSIAANIIALSALAAELASRRADDAVLDKVIRNFELLKDLASTLTERQEIYQIID